MIFTVTTMMSYCDDSAINIQMATVRVPLANAGE